MATQQRYPTGDEATTGTWATSPYWSKVDDTSDADFITCSAAGRQTFTFTAFSVPAGATGISVALNFRGDKTAAQSANLGGALKVGGNYYTATGRNPANGVFTAYTDTWATNPKTSAAWTVDDINGVGATNPLQAFGMSSTDASPTVNTSSCEIVVSYTPAAVTGAAALAAAATVTTVGTRFVKGLVALSVTATQTAVGRLVLEGVATVSAATTQTAAGQRIANGVASLVAAVTQATVGWRLLTGASGLAATGTMTSIGQRLVAGIGSLASITTAMIVGTVTQTGPVVTGIATLASTAIQTTVGRLLRTGVAVLSSGATATAIGRRSTLGTATLIVATTVAVLGNVAIDVLGRATLYCSTVINVSATVSRITAHVEQLGSGISTGMAVSAIVRGIVAKTSLSNHPAIVTAKVAGG